MDQTTPQGPTEPPKMPGRQNARLPNMTNVRNLADRLARKSSPIVPSSTVIGRALVLVTAIMCFLACLALGTAWSVHRAAVAWAGDAASELTLQIKPVDGRDMANDITEAMRILNTVQGVTRAQPVSLEETRKLLEPWLGTDLEIDDLPIPQLIVLEVDKSNPPNLQALEAEIRNAVPGAELDDHSIWRDQIRTAAGWIKWASFLVLALMLGATIAIIIFATRGAMSSNRDVVDVLHLVGARDRFIAREFEQHFLILGLKGGLAGGLAACAAFILGGFALGQIAPRSLDGELNTLVQAVSLGWAGFIGIAGIVTLLAVIISLTSRFTVHRYLKGVE